MRGLVGQRLRQLVRVGDVVALHKDARDRVIGLANGLKHQIDIARLERTFFFALQRQRDGAADLGLARGEHGIELGQKTLLDHLGQGPRQLVALHRAVPDELVERIVGKLDAVLRALQHADETRCLLEQLLQILALGPRQLLHATDPLRRGAGRHRDRVECRRCGGFGIGAPQPGELGNIGRMAEDALDLARGVQDGNMGDRPETAGVVVVGEGGDVRHGITHERQGMTPPLAKHPGQRRLQALALGRVGHRKDVEQRPPHQVLAQAPDVALIGLVARQDRKIGCQQKISVGRLLENLPETLEVFRRSRSAHGEPEPRKGRPLSYPSPHAPNSH